MTPDANPLLGPLPGVRGFWVAAGLSLNGFGGGGGIGRAMAGWITAGDPDVDIGAVPGVAVRRHVPRSEFAAGLARETYSDYYRLRYPYDADVAGRPRRLSAAPRPAPGGRRGLRHEGRLGAGGPATSPGGRGGEPAATRRPTAGPRPPWFDRVGARSTAPSASGSGSST